VQRPPERIVADTSDESDSCVLGDRRSHYVRRTPTASTLDAHGGVAGDVELADRAVEPDDDVLDEIAHSGQETGHDTGVKQTCQTPAMTDIEAFRSATDWAAAIRSKEVSPIEVAELYLERMDRLDPELNAFCLRDDDTVRAAARTATDAIANGDALGPFHGVPLPIKDLNPVGGWPTSYGSEGGSSAPSPFDDAVVSRFRAAGFVFTGKTNTPELGTISCTENTRFGATRNPWDPNHTPGGSSGGAGAAVASGMAPIAHASDGGGSIRIPASCNGLVGLKPSRNRITNLVNGIEGFATDGVLTRTVADTAAALDVLAVPDPQFWYNAPPETESFATSTRREPGRLRIGITATPTLDIPVDHEVFAAHAAAAELLAGLGHDVFEVDLSVADPDAFVASFTVVWNTGSAGLPIDVTKMEPLNLALRAQAQAVDSVAYVDAVYRTQLLCRQLIAPFGSQFDVLLTPTMACLPPEVGSVWAGADLDPVMPLFNCFPMAAFTAVWNVTGMPAISLPLGQSASGLPIGVQLVGGAWQDALLLRLAAQIEQAAPWSGRCPTVS
jgi:amidase